MRQIGRLSLVLVAIGIGGCEIRQQSVKPKYGQEFARSYESSQTAGQLHSSPQNPRFESDPFAKSPETRAQKAPIVNPGRPEPPESEIPGISDIPEIPDEPKVLSR